LGLRTAGAGTLGGDQGRSCPSIASFLNNADPSGF
jgi:hypothetical protein